MAQVLIVDDDAATREWLTEILEVAGHRVFAARDGLEARSLAKGLALDVVITDISMPNEEGLGLLLAMRRMYPKLKIVVLSGQDPETLSDAILLGADAALRKPIPSKTVLECLNVLTKNDSTLPV
jgi:YesN/AraC family two-component response regulator